MSFITCTGPLPKTRVGETAESFWFYICLAVWFVVFCLAYCFFKSVREEYKNIL